VRRARAAQLSGDAPEAISGFMSRPVPEHAQANGCPRFLDSYSFGAPYSRGYVGMEPCQYSFSGVGNSLANSPFLASGIRVVQNPFDLPPNGDSGHHLTTGSHLGVDAFPQPGTAPIGSAQDWMQHRLNVPDAQQLADLSESQLENIAKDVAQALALAKQKRIQGSVKPATLERQNSNADKMNKGEKGSQKKRPLLECEHPGCSTTFRHNKDRTRHVRNKHQEAPGLACPILDCTMGTGHIMTRLDKLRDHLRGKGALSRTWRCVIPDCSTIGENKSWWFEHVAHHDQETRVANKDLLTNYGYRDFYGGYLTSIHLCRRRGCPFGTNLSAAMDEHLLIPHKGPHCPCLIRDCQTICSGWEELAQHLASGHTFAARRSVEGVLRDHGFEPWQYSFACPILSCHWVIKRPHWVRNMDVRKHCREHDFVTLLSAAEPLVNAWRIAFGGRWISTEPFKFNLNSEEPSSNQIFAFLAYPDAELFKANMPKDLDRLCLEKGINLP
jgi:hypothetical protein